MKCHFLKATTRLCSLRDCCPSLCYLVIQEDNKVIHLVQEYGPKRWTLISKHLKGRTGKQCRERYVMGCQGITLNKKWRRESTLMYLRAMKGNFIGWRKLAAWMRCAKHSVIQCICCDSVFYSHYIQHFINLILCGNQGFLMVWRLDISGQQLKCS